MALFEDPVTLGIALVTMLLTVFISIFQVGRMLLRLHRATKGAWTSLHMRSP